jgi:hypothetical protein
MFKLNIESTKDINELHIKFADGSSVVTTSSNNHLASASGVPVHEVVTPTQKKSARKEEFLNLDADFGGVSQEIVKPPEINRSDRPVKVANELQNLDI